MFNQILRAGCDNRDVRGRIFPKAVGRGRGGGFVEREGWEATAVPAVTYSVTGTNNARTGRVTRWFVF